MTSYQEKFIKDLSHNDSKVALSGFIIDRKENMLVIDDTTGTIIAFVENKLDKNHFARVFGNLVRTDNGFQLYGDIVQNLNAVNKKIYNKVKVLMNRK